MDRIGSTDPYILIILDRIGSTDTKITTILDRIGKNDTIQSDPIIPIRSDPVMPIPGLDSQNLLSFSLDFVCLATERKKVTIQKISGCISWNSELFSIDNNQPFFWNAVYSLFLKTNILSRIMNVLINKMMFKVTDNLRD